MEIIWINDGSDEMHTKILKGLLEKFEMSTKYVRVKYYENDGNQNFTRDTITTTTTGGSSVYAMDLDSDGDMDVLSASSDDNKIAWYENNGNQSFTANIITTSAYSI